METTGSTGQNSSSSHYSNFGALFCVRYKCRVIFLQGSLVIITTRNNTSFWFELSTYRVLTYAVIAKSWGRLKHAIVITVNISL